MVCFRAVDSVAIDLVVCIPLDAYVGCTVEAVLSVGGLIDFVATDAIASPGVVICVVTTVVCVDFCNRVPKDDVVCVAVVDSVVREMSLAVVSAVNTVSEDSLFCVVNITCVSADTDLLYLGVEL